jgi:uncharacterized protein (DUF2132 family)
MQRTSAALRPDHHRDNQAMNTPNTAAQPRNPLHGLTLEMIVTQLADHYGWHELGTLIPIRCFTHEPSIGSSLKFLRRTPWARDKVESLYLYMLRQQKRHANTHGTSAQD